MESILVLRILIPIDGGPFARRTIALHDDETTAATHTVLKFFRDKNWNFELVTRTGIAGDEIAKLARSNRFDLVVRGTHGHGAFMSLVLGSTAQRVHARCKTPVLLIR